MDWIKKAAATLRRLSIEQTQFGIALGEWSYSGDAYAFDTYALDSVAESCELCAQSHQQFLFTIINRHNSNALLVGPECIGKFGSVATAASSSPKNIARNRLAHALLCDEKQKTLINTLIALAGADASFAIQGFMAPILGRTAFTPEQLALLLWRLQEFKIDYSNCVFKLALRKDCEREQLRTMEHWKIKKLWPLLSARQRTWVQRHSGYRH